MARRSSDGRLVSIKILRRSFTSWREVQSTKLLYENHRRLSPANLCTPIVDLFEDEDQPNTIFAVALLLRATCKDSFQRVDDILQFISQVLLVRSISSFSITCVVFGYLMSLSYKGYFVHA